MLVIGGGHWGKNLIKNLHALGALQAVAEANDQTREALALQYPEIPVFSDYREALKLEATGVAIATPVATHYAIAKDALSAGKDAFIEKPMTMAAREAEELIQLASSKNRILMVGHLLLYQPAVQWLKSFLDSGELGRILSLHQERLNFGKARAVENALWSLGVHDVAVLLYLVGKAPSDVEIVGQRALQPSVEDDVYLHLRFAEGPQAHLHTAWLWPEKRRRLTIIGTRGMLVYDEADQTVMLHNKSISGDLAHSDQGSSLVFQGHGEPLKLEMMHFLERLRDRQPPLSDGKSGLEVIQVLETATHKLETR